MDTILRCTNLSKTYAQGENSVAALQPTTLDFSTGEFTAITGRSGSGKSTLLHLLGGLDEPSTGAVFVDGASIYELNDKKRTELRCKKLGFVFQSFNLIPELTAYENVRLPLDLSAEAVDNGYINELFHILDLNDRQHFYPSQLSGGQQQRVAIARALAAKPLMILADEPTGNLDAKSSSNIIEYFEKLNREFGQAILIVTHDAAISGRAKRNIVIEDGIVISDITGR